MDASLTTYRTIRTTYVHLSPDSVARYEITVDSIIACRSCSSPAWLCWVKNGVDQGYIRAGDLALLAERTA